MICVNLKLWLHAALEGLCNMLAACSTRRGPNTTQLLKLEANSNEVQKENCANEKKFTPQQMQRRKKKREQKAA